VGNFDMENEHYAYILTVDEKYYNRLTQQNKTTLLEPTFSSEKARFHPKPPSNYSSTLQDPKKCRCLEPRILWSG
jgi:hypothetical protein